MKKNKYHLLKTIKKSLISKHLWMELLCNKYSLLRVLSRLQQIYLLMKFSWNFVKRKKESIEKHPYAENKKCHLLKSMFKKKYHMKIFSDQSKLKIISKKTLILNYAKKKIEYLMETTKMNWFLKTMIMKR
jgi:hypothetical protein